MKVLSEQMASTLMRRTTTLCWCWRLTRRDGVVLGFTDHDRDLTFDGTRFEAAAGFSAGELTESVGLNVDHLDVDGAVTSDRLDAQDLLAGLYDDAKVEIFRVNWQDPAERVAMRTGSLGEVRRAGHAFRAEVRGLQHYLQQPKGRIFQYACDADLGDRRCQVDLNDPAFGASGTVRGVVDQRSFNVDGLGAFAGGWFDRGLLTFTGGDNAGGAYEVRDHAVIVDTVAITLWRLPAHGLGVGDTFTVTAGCDKVLATCRDKFRNTVNYRGFAHMPGTDFVTSYVRRS